MSILGIIIGTAVLWALTYGVVVPLAKWFAEMKRDASTGSALPEIASPTSASTGPMEVKIDAIDSVPTETFVLAHVLVLGAAGLLLGALGGMFFIGFATKAKMWPGMIALIVASLLASS